MNEKDLNIKYIREKTGLVENDELIPIILEMIQESYKAGLCQAEYDNTMGLIEENQQLKEQLEASEKARKESMRILGEYRHYTLSTEEQNRENEDIIDKAYNNLILKQDIDKGE